MPQSRRDDQAGREDGLSFTHRFASKSSELRSTASRLISTGVLDPLGDAADLLIDLDTDRSHDPDALVRYVHQLLIAAKEPGVFTPYQPISLPGTARPALGPAAAREPTGARSRGRWRR